MFGTQRKSPVKFHGISLVVIVAVFLCPASCYSSVATEAAVDALLAGKDGTAVPGCSVAAMKDGAIVYKRGFGMANLDYGIPNRPDTVFHVASISKQFTAAAIALLVLDGKLLLDDEVRRYLPELPDFGAPITLRQLIHHTSGLRDQWSLLEMSGWRYSQDLITNDDVMGAVKRQKTLNFPPGSRFSYSNTGYTLLALIVEQVTGKTLRAFAQERIFIPLGMNSTFFRDDHAQVVRNLAVGYVPHGSTFKSSITNFDTVGATSLLTTVEDLLFWDENFYNPRVGGAAFVAQMLERDSLNNGERVDYAFGLEFETYRGLTVIKHAGTDAGYRAQLLRFPDQHFSVACLCNTSTAGSRKLALQIADIYLDKELEPLPKQAASRAGVELSPAQLLRHSGLYLRHGSGSVLRFFVEDGVLRQQAFGSIDSQPLVALGENRFWSAGASQEIVFSGQGSARRAAVMTGGPAKHADKVYQFVPEQAAPVARLTDYAGTYASEEMPLPYRVTASGQTLNAHWLKRQLTLTPVTHDVFFDAEIGTVTFWRRGGRVTGFVIDGERASGLRFVKTSVFQ